jgi:hypothetical protein
LEASLWADLPETQALPHFFHAPIIVNSVRCIYFFINFYNNDYLGVSFAGLALGFDESKES